VFHEFSLQDSVMPKPKYMQSLEKKWKKKAKLGNWHKMKSTGLDFSFCVLYQPCCSIQYKIYMRYDTPIPIGDGHLYALYN